MDEHHLRARWKENHPGRRIRRRFFVGWIAGGGRSLWQRCQPDALAGRDNTLVLPPRRDLFERNRRTRWIQNRGGCRQLGIWGGAPGIRQRRSVHPLCRWRRTRGHREPGCNLSITDYFGDEERFAGGG